MLSLREGNLSAQGDEKEYNKQVMQRVGVWETCFITLFFPLSCCIKRQTGLSGLCGDFFVVAAVVKYCLEPE